jgi:hypothetical protein
MMDTTGSIMRQYVTVTMIAISHNMAMPLAFSFGPVEGAEIYDTFYKCFIELFDIDLSRFTLESDQGSGLGKFARLHGFTQRFCLRDFLAALQHHAFFVFVHHLVKVRTDSEFLLLSAQYPQEIQKAIDHLPGSGPKRARGEFLMTGLDLIEVHAVIPEIRITDTVRWQRVSSILKVRQRLPMTTNARESINGHRNEAIPRNNTFSMPMVPKIGGEVDVDKVGKEFKSFRKNGCNRLFKERLHYRFFLTDSRSEISF